MPRRVCSVEAGVELAMCGEDIWTTKGANPRERHETSHLVNGIEVGDWIERGACSGLRVPWGYVSRSTFHGLGGFWDLAQARNVIREVTFHGRAHGVTR